MLGVRRTTVTLLARELQKRGVIRCRGRITILDWRGMDACACECYRAVKRLSRKANSWIYRAAHPSGQKTGLADPVMRPIRYRNRSGLLARMVL